MRKVTMVATAALAAVGVLAPAATATAVSAPTPRERALQRGRDVASLDLAFAKHYGVGARSTKSLNAVDAKVNRATGGRERIWGIQDKNRNGVDDDGVVYLIAWNKAHTRWITVATIKFASNSPTSRYTVTTTIR